MCRITVFVLVSFTAAFSVQVAAQSPNYRDVTTTSLPPGLAGACMNAAAGDADGDGDLDLALAMEFQQNILLLNAGDGRFSDATAQLPMAEHDSEDVAFADFDNDGDQDLVFVSEDDRTDELYLNDGNGNFTDASSRLDTDDVSNDLAVFDLNGDGLPDLLTGNIGTDRVLISDGEGGFRDETTQRWPQSGESRTQDLEAADIDGDGDLDVIVGNEGQNGLFLNESGVLRDATATTLPVRNDETRKIEALDADRDGDLDLLVGNVQFGMEESARDYLLLNDGGVFTTAGVDAMPEDERSNFVTQTVDLDADGDIDILAPSTVFPDTDFHLLMMSVDTGGNPVMLKVDELFFTDTDGDGDLDARVKAGAQEMVFISAGGGLMPEGDISTWENVQALAGADFSGDGADDVLSVEMRLSESRAGTPADTDTFYNQMLQVIDVDRDGDIDAIIPVTQSMNSIGDYAVLLNDGSGHFTPAAAGSILPDTVSGNGFDIEVADYDGDGLDDLFLCNRASSRDNAVATGGQQQLLLRQRSQR